MNLSKTGKLFSIIIVLIVISSLLAYFVDYLYGHPFIPYSDTWDYFLTVALGSFAAVEGFSTFLQYKLSEKRFLIEDAWKELERAYGPVYAIINKWHLEKDKKGEAFWVKSDDRCKLDEIFAKYNFVFSDEIMELWRKHVQTAVYTENLKIPLEFRNKFNKEYDRVENYYNKLLKKPNIQNSN